MLNWQILMINEGKSTEILKVGCLFLLNPCTDATGDGYPPPDVFRKYYGKTAPRHEIWHDYSFIFYTWCASRYLLPWKVRSVWITRPHITFLQLWDRVRARVDGRVLWKLQDVMCPQAPTTCVSRIFLYRWPKVRSISWPTRYKWMRKKINCPISYKYSL